MKAPRLAVDLIELVHTRAPSLVRLEREAEVLIREGRIQRSLAFVAGASGLLGGLEVAYEHYRGSYGQRIMYTPVILSAALAGSAFVSVESRRAARTLMPAASLLLLADGVIGFGYHVRGIARKPGGWRLPVTNLVMGPPVLAPLLLGIGGYLGFVASFMRREDDPPRARPTGSWQTLELASQIREGRYQKHMAAATAFSSVLCGIEALYSHYKNNFRFKAQWTPVILAPSLAAVAIGAIFSRRIARTALPAVSAIALLDGAIGFAYHARGVLRRPGGARRLGYNVMYGPPILAPLLFAATGFLGLLASLLRRERS
ncbi:MAG: hypothetical protein ABJE66_08595 [Deltaproteobacteria bacterium]